MNYHKIAYIVLSFIMAASFISIFFFTYVSKVEGDVIKNQLSNTISNFGQSTSVYLSPEEKNTINNIITNNLSLPDMTEQDKKAADNNRKLLIKSIIIFSILLIVGIVIVITMTLVYKLNFIQIIKYSLIILFLVSITEILFVTFVSKNYRLVDDNYFKYLLVDNLQQYANS